MRPSNVESGDDQPDGRNGRDEPLLYARRERVVEADGGTTACRSSTTSPVAEYTPDD